MCVHTQSSWQSSHNNKKHSLSRNKVISHSIHEINQSHKKADICIKVECIVFRQHKTRARDRNIRIFILDQSCSSAYVNNDTMDYIHIREYYINLLSLASFFFVTFGNFSLSLHSFIHLLRSLDCFFFCRLNSELWFLTRAQLLTDFSDTHKYSRDFFSNAK